MKDNLDRIAPFLPWFGLLLLVAGGISYFVTGMFEIVTNSLLLLGIISLLLYVVFRPDDIRRFAGGRRAKYGTITTLSILLFLVIGVLLYIVVYQNENWGRFDLTATNEFTPLDETIELLENFDEPIEVIGFYTPASAARRQTAEERLQSLAAYKSDLTFEFSDPVSNPVLADQYEVTADTTLVFIRNRGQENEITSQAPTTTDRDIHTALVQLINPTEKIAYFLIGHGELDSVGFTPESAGEIAGSLRDLGFTNQQLDLSVEGAIPEDADVVVLLGQRAPMLPEEVAALNEYLNNGGAAFIARDVLREEGQVLAEEDNLRQMLLDEWGLRLRTDYIIETELPRAGQQIPVAFLSMDFGTSPITTRDLQELGIYFEFARSVDVQEAIGITYAELARTTENSWGEANLVDFPQFGQEDTPGPVVVAVSAENTATGGRLVLVGDVDFLNNNNSTTRANSLFFSNSMNWLAGDEAALELTPRETINRSVTLSESQLGLIQLVSCLTGPILVSLIGLYVWFSRRRNK